MSGFSFCRLVERWRAWRRARELDRRIRSLTPEARARLLAHSVYETYWEQGMEGAAYVIRRDEKDFGDAMAKGGGYFDSVEAAENFIIAREFESEDARPS